MEKPMEISVTLTCYWMTTQKPLRIRRLYSSVILKA